MKRFVLLAITVILAVGAMMCISANALTDVSGLGSKDSLKILAIGNSFSEDSTEYLPTMAKDLGIKEIIVGNMYIGGCTIEKHATNARENNADYKYYKNTRNIPMSRGPYTNGVSLETALKDEEWDVVTLQHSSGHSGIETFYNADLEYLIDYVKSYCPNAKIGWHMTWAYQSDCTLSSFRSNYRNNQKLMYGQIASCAEKKIVPNEKIDFIIPAGTAIQNARTSYLGDTLTRDGYHLDLYIGRYIVGATWMKSMGYSLEDLRTLPNKLSSKVMPFVVECAENAVKTPFAVTDSSYTYEPGTTPPETTVATEVTTDAPDAESVTVGEDKAEPTANGNETTGQEKNDTKVFDGTVLGIIGACVGVAIAAAIAVIVVKKKKK